MISKAILRVLLVLALILTAHVLKPFSIRSIGNHVLGSARSLSFILPGETANGIKQVSYLAHALHTDWKTITEPATPAWTESTVAKSGLMACEKQPKLATSRREKTLRARRPSVAHQPAVVAMHSAIAVPKEITIRLFLSASHQTVERTSKVAPQRLALISSTSTLISSQGPESYLPTLLRKGDVKRDELEQALSWLACKGKWLRGSL